MGFRLVLHKAQLMSHGESKIGGRNIRDPRNVSSDCCSRGAHNLQSEHVSHLRFGKSKTLSASIDTTFFIALVGLNMCDAVHNPIHQVGCRSI